MQFRVVYLTEEMTWVERTETFQAPDRTAALQKVEEIRKRGDDPRKLERVIEIPLPKAA